MVATECLTNMLRFLDFFNRSSNCDQRKDVPSFLYVDNTPLSDLKALGSGIFKPAITKASRLSLQGRTPDNQKVKIYSGFSPAQISLRLELDNIQVEQPICFPRVVLNDEFLLVEEWVDGTQLNELPPARAMEYAPQVEAFLKQFQHDPILVALAEKHIDAFCYLNDYLISRLNIWAQWKPVKALIGEWRRTENAVVDLLPKFLSHPDLSLSNLILEHSTDKLYIIDNELFGVGRSWIIDGKNSFCKERFKIDSSDTLTQRFASLSWKLRLVGSALDAGDFERAERLARFE